MNTRILASILATSTNYGKLSTLRTTFRFSHFQRGYARTGSLDSSRYLEVKESPNKGLGVFATEDISPFTHLVSDTALISLSSSEDLPQAFEQYNELSTEQRTQFFNFHSFYKPERDVLLAKKLAARGLPSTVIPEMVHVSSIFTSNAFNVDDGSGNSTFRRTMFPLISRINHSCVPNAHTNYDHSSATMSLFSLSMIPRGHEIEISYFNLLLPRDFRKTKAGKWDFSCECPACESGATGEANHFEARREKIREIEKYLADATSKDAATVSDLRSCILKAQDMVTLVLEEDSLRPQLPIAYDYVATFQAVAFQVTKDRALLDPILDSLDFAVKAEADITGNTSPATENRRRKREAIGRMVSNIS